MVGDAKLEMGETTAWVPAFKQPLLLEAPTILEYRLPILLRLQPKLLALPLEVRGRASSPQTSIKTLNQRLPWRSSG